MKTAKQTRKLLEKRRRPTINAETCSAGVGPLTIDVEMARNGGWSEKAIARTYKKIAALSRKENAIAHRNGLVPGCSGIECDLSVPIENLPSEYVAMRKAILKKLRPQYGRKHRAVFVGTTNDCVGGVCKIPRRKLKICEPMWGSCKRNSGHVGGHSQTPDFDPRRKR